MSKTGTGLDPLAALGVSDACRARLEQLVALMQKWNPAINLVARSTLADAWNRHILDSAQIYSLGAVDARIWADLGSGGGYPGLVIACIAADLHPAMQVVLVESDQRKATYLRQAAQTLGLKVRVEANRIEQLPAIGADVVSARALASLDRLCAFAVRHLTSGGVALFPKGENHLSEVELARKQWSFTLDCTPSVTDANAVILKLKDLSHV